MMTRKIRITEGDIRRMVTESVKRILREEAGGPEGSGEKERLLADLEKTIQRADFYYPMSDDYRGVARDEFYESQNRYGRILENPEFSDEEREAYQELWDLRKRFTGAQMSGNDSEAGRLEQEYGELFGRLFS